MGGSSLCCPGSSLNSWILRDWDCRHTMLHPDAICFIYLLFRAKMTNRDRLKDREKSHQSHRLFVNTSCTAALATNPDPWQKASLYSRWRLERDSTVWSTSNCGVFSTNSHPHPTKAQRTSQKNSQREDHRLGDPAAKDFTGMTKSLYSWAHGNCGCQLGHAQDRASQSALWRGKGRVSQDLSIAAGLLAAGSCWSRESYFTSGVGHDRFPWWKAPTFTVHIGSNS